MNGSLDIGLLSENKIDEFKLIKFSKKLSDLFHKYYPNIITECRHNNLLKMCEYRYEADINIRFYRKDIICYSKRHQIKNDIKWDIYFDRIYKIYKAFSKIIEKDYNYQVVCMGQT